MNLELRNAKFNGQMKTESSQRRQVLPQKKKKKYFKKKGEGHQCAVRKVKQDEDSLWAMEMIIDLTRAV